MHESIRSFLRAFANARIIVNRQGEVLSGKLYIYMDGHKAFKRIPRRMDSISYSRLHRHFISEFTRLQEVDNAAYPYSAEDFNYALRSMGVKVVKGRSPRVMLTTPERDRFDDARSLEMKLEDERTANEVGAMIGMLVESFDMLSSPKELAEAALAASAVTSSVN
jgi:hypothetical protein